MSEKSYDFMRARADYYSSHHQRARGHKTIGSHLKRSPINWLSLLLGDSRYIEKKLSECTRKNDELNSLAKMTNSINCTKFRNN